jgi:hypothetical protein
MRWGRLLTVLAIVALAAFLLYRRHEARRALTADEAMAKGYVVVSMSYGPTSASDPAVLEPAATGDSDKDGPNVIAVTFARQTGSPDRDITVTLPAGTVVSDAALDHQRLITTARVSVRLAPGSQSVVVSVPTFCLDQFMPPPSPGATLGLALTGGGGGGGGDSGLKRVGKLVDCMRGIDAPFMRRQDAVWLVEQGLFDKAPADAKDLLQARWREAMGKGADDKLTGAKAGFETAIHSQHPDFSEPQMHDTLALITRDMLQGRIDQRAGELAQGNFRDFLLAKTILANCGYDVDKLPMFKA